MIYNVTVIIIIRDPESLDGFIDIYF